MVFICLCVVCFSSKWSDENEIFNSQILISSVLIVYDIILSLSINNEYLSLKCFNIFVARFEDLLFVSSIQWTGGGREVR